MSGHASDSTRRFTDRVADYVRFRPRYPEELFDTVVAMVQLLTGAAVADVGSGTGISTGPFIRRGCNVFAIEPNDAMRAAAEAEFGANPLFHSIAATAEDTGLPDSSVDLICCGQAFHWFDAERTRAEFGRILRRSGWVALFWNERLAEIDPFAGEYEEICRIYGADYDQALHRNFDPRRLDTFFPAGFQTYAFAHQQRFDWDGVRGRLLSASYVPKVGQPLHESMIGALREAFDRHQRDGRITFPYETKLYIGRFD